MSLPAEIEKNVIYSPIFHLDALANKNITFFSEMNTAMDTEEPIFYFNC